MAMTTADARLTYDYALRDAALERIRRLKRAGYDVKLRYEGENREGVVEVEPPSFAQRFKGRSPVVTITLSRYTDVALMERTYEGLIEILGCAGEHIKALIA